MKRKDLIFLGAMACMVAAFMATNITAAAYEKPLEIKACGRYEHDADGSGIIGDSPTDVIYDAEDIYYLYELCK